MNVQLIRLSEVAIADIVALHNDPRVLRHMPLARRAVDESQCREWVQGKEAQWDENGYGPWGILIDGCFAGWGGLQQERGDADLALVLSPDYWGSGRRIVQKILDIAFDEMGLESVTALLPSGRVRVRGMLRMGFQAEGQVRISGSLFHRYRLRAPGRISRPDSADDAGIASRRHCC
ncbi:MAG: GNAT family N-acetyltransferase [Gammaproteobacteria bacterium]|nr:GNAT family N-acetyltransferase [Gammaproteobacteria bacterium]